MKHLFIILFIVVSLFSCNKKDPAIVPSKDPWVIQGYLYHQRGFVNMVMLRDTFVALYNEDFGPRFYTGDSETGIFYGQNAPETIHDYDMYVFEAYEDRIYAATENEGIFYSSDLSSTWVQLTDGLPGYITVQDIVATDAGLYLCAGKIYFSNDKGDHWTDISVPGLDQTVAIVAIDNTLIARVYNGSIGADVNYTSEDNGAHWTARDPLSEMPQLPIYKLFSVNNLLYAITYDGNYTFDVYVSSDKAISWVKSKGLNSLGDVRCFEFHNGTVYAGSAHGVYKSIDNGQNWTYSGCNDVRALVKKNNSLFAVGSEGVWKISL